MATSFSTIKNRPGNTASRIQVINTTVVQPENNIVMTYGPYPFGVTEDKSDILHQNRPLYMLINLHDTVGVYQTLRFDTIRIYVTNLVGNTSIKLQFGVFRLNDDAIFGDSTTYNNKSTLISKSEILTINSNDGPKADGKGFFDIKWEKSIDLPVCIGNVEARYFLCVLLTEATNDIQLLAQGKKWLASDLENYCFMDADSSVTSFPATIGNPVTPASDDPGFFHYYSLYKRQ